MCFVIFHYQQDAVMCWITNFKTQVALNQFATRTEENVMKENVPKTFFSSLNYGKTA